MSRASSSRSIDRSSSAAFSALASRLASRTSTCGAGREGGGASACLSPPGARLATQAARLLVHSLQRGLWLEPQPPLADQVLRHLGQALLALVLDNLWPVLELQAAGETPHVRATGGVERGADTAGGGAPASQSSPAPAHSSWAAARAPTAGWANARARRFSCRGTVDPPSPRSWHTCAAAVNGRLTSGPIPGGGVRGPSSL